MVWHILVSRGGSPRLPMGDFLFMRNTLYDAIFLTVSELLAKMSDFFLNFRRILVPNWRQRWPPFSHFESDDLICCEFLRHDSLHLCNISAPQWLQIFRAKMSKSAIWHSKWSPVSQLGSNYVRLRTPPWPTDHINAWNLNIVHYVRHGPLT